MPPELGGGFSTGTLIEFDVRGINSDETVSGACPYKLDPDRAISAQTTAAIFSFGDGPHRCPGAKVALQESAVFLDKLFRVAGFRLEREPDITWVQMIEGYELSGAVITCDPC